jgi:ADP-heptose:LPS heptosyltransferase
LQNPILLSSATRLPDPPRSADPGKTLRALRRLGGELLTPGGQLLVTVAIGEDAALDAAAQCYVGIDSGLMWIAGSLQVPTVGLYGTTYLPNVAAVQPANPNATYLKAAGGLDAIEPAAILAAVRATQANGMPQPPSRQSR